MKVWKNYANRDVRLTDERVRHVMRHPEMTDMEAAIEETLRAPKVVIQSRMDEQTVLHYRFYFGTKVGDKWLCVVVKYPNGDAFVVTAYMTDMIKKGEQLWPSR